MASHFWRDLVDNVGPSLQSLGSRSGPVLKYARSKVCAVFSSSHQKMRTKMKTTPLVTRILRSNAHEMRLAAACSVSDQGALLTGRYQHLTAYPCKLIR